MVSTKTKIPDKIPDKNTTTQLQQPEWNSTTRIEDVDKNGKAKRAVADVILKSDTTGLTKIHSKASISTVLDRHESSSHKTCETGMDMSESERAKKTIRQQAAMDKPLTVVTYHDAAHNNKPNITTISALRPLAKDPASNMTERILYTLKNDPNYVQNLPYMYRSPSI